MAPAKFLADVRAEMGKVVWPSRRETLITTGLVLGFALIASLFFFVADQAIGLAVHALFASAA